MVNVPIVDGVAVANTTPYFDKGLWKCGKCGDVLCNMHGWWLCVTCQQRMWKVGTVWVDIL